MNSEMPVVVIARLPRRTTHYAYPNNSRKGQFWQWGGRSGDVLVIVASNPAFGKCSTVWIAWQAEHVTTDQEQRKMAVCGVSH